MGWLMGFLRVVLSTGMWWVARGCKWFFIPRYIYRIPHSKRPLDMLQVSDHPMFLPRSDIFGSFGKR